LLRKSAEHLPNFVLEFSDIFASTTHDCFEKSLSYIEGLFKSPKGRANCLYMGDHLKDKDSQSIHHMLTSSPWSYQSLFDRMLKRVDKLLSKQNKKVYLLVDEVGFRKKGKQSACVGSQYLGCIGKNDNGQVAVVAALSAGEFYAPVSAELFMPQHWESNTQGRIKTGIPDSISHRPKTKMAVEMILRIHKKIKNLEYVVFDALYGSCMNALDILMKNKIPFVGDVRENITIYLAAPRMIIAINKGRGRKNTKPRPVRKGISICHYQEQLKENDYKELNVREGTNGIISAKYHLRKVWILCKETEKFLPLNLLVRKNEDGTIKYALGYHPIKATMKDMAKAQAQRAFVERVFEEGKNIVGMADYQVRSWVGFHRHMTLCSLALLFLMEQKLELKKTIGIVTAYQIQELVNATIQTLHTLEEVITHLTVEIPKYQQQIFKKQRKTVT
jgi:SRSO17 transposase